MNTILIAEDEKFIRRGLRTMIERSAVPTGEILEARDGEEALEILRQRPVDLLVTDIRMPRMDGLELVSHMGELDHQPMVLVVSGYDDFSYAVEMLRSGVQDYLLKPVERERLYQALEKLEEQYERKQAAREEQDRHLRRALRQLMLEDMEQGGQRELAERVRDRFFPGPYVGFCTGERDRAAPEGTLRLRGVGNIMFYAASEEECARLEALPIPVGRSGVHRGVESLHACYQEACAAWKRSFFTGEACVSPAEPGSRAPGVNARQLAGLVGLSRGQEVSRLLAGEAESVARGETDPDGFAQLCADFVRQLRASYQDMLALATDAERFANIWDFPSCAQYLEALDQWLEFLCGQAAQERQNFGYAVS